MDKKEKILDEVNKTLQVMDDLKNLDGNPFLYTRLKTRLAAEKRPAPSHWHRLVLILRPAGLLVLFLLNIYTAVYFINNKNTNKEEIASENSTIIEKFTEKYSNNTNLFFFYNEGITK